MLFYYKREVKRKVKEEMPIGTDEKWVPQEKIVSEIYWDCFNVNKVIRGHWTSENEFTVMLDDGHEQADDIEKPKFNAKRQVVGVEIKRERGWYMSQIVLDRHDADRLRTSSELSGIV